MTEILCIVGARPNFMKIAPIMAAFAARGVRAKLVHTGQHYDPAMSDSFFEQLGIPRPDVNLEVGSASHAVQTAEIMRAFEPVLDEERPRAVLVVGDVNSTIACALVAAKKGIKVIHVEAGLRSYDRAMPEEINRVLTDQISDLLFTTEREAEANLQKEGIAAERVHFVGNVMIDTLRMHLERAVPAATTLRGRPARGYAAVTLHRPSNVDEPTVFKGLLDTLNRVAEHVDVVFPIHPRTRATAEKFGFTALRTKEHFESASDFVAPADCWGDVGAAGGLLHIVLACAAAGKGYSSGPISMTWASAERGERAAVVSAQAE